MRTQTANISSPFKRKFVIPLINFFYYTNIRRLGYTAWGEGEEALRFTGIFREFVSTCGTRRCVKFGVALTNVRRVKAR